MNQIHNSVAGSVGDYPSNAAGSIEMDPANALGSLAGTDILTYGEGLGDTQTLPDDDIEKSFRVNQDGSMTVEMKVRLTIKEEETVHWTTTLSRSAVSSEIRESSPIAGDVDTDLPDLSQLPPPHTDSDVDAMENSSYNQDLPPPPMNETVEDSEQGMEEEEQGESAQVLSPLAHRVPTPGPRKTRQMHASEENVQQGSESEARESIVGTYSYREEKQEYCMVRQTTNRPVPKPRNANLSEANKTMNSSTSVQSQYKSAEVLKVQDSAEEIRETVLHIYEQQTCQDNFVANTQVRVQGVSVYSPLHGRPATSETLFPASSDRTLRSSSLDLESELNPSTPSKQADNMSLSSNFNTPTSHVSYGTDKCSSAVSGKKMSDLNQQTAENNGDSQSLTKKKKPVKIVLKKNSHIFQSTTSEKKRREHVAEILKGIRKRKSNPGSSPGSVKGIDRLRTKAAQTLLKKRQRLRAAEYDVPVSDKTSVQPTDTITQVKENQNELSKAVLENKKVEKGENLNAPQKRNILEVEGLQGKVGLIRQTSMHDERRTTREMPELSESVSLPALNSSSSMINEYVEQWLRTSRQCAVSDMEEEPPCNVELNSESASQIGDERQALFQVSTDKEVSLEIGCEMIHMTEDPCEEAVTANLPSLVQLSKMSQDSFEAAEAAILAEEVMQDEEKDFCRSNGFHYTQPASNPSPANPTVERNTIPTHIHLAKETELSDESQNIKDLPTPKPLPRSNTLEKTRAVNLEKTSSSRNESQRKIAKNNETTQASQKAVEDTSLNPSPMSPLVENMVTKPGTESTASSVSHKKTNGQVIKNINFPPMQQETDRSTQTANVVPTQKSYTVRMAARPDMKPVVEQLCLSIQSIKDTTQQRRPSCLEKSNSLPDFSSHIASTFGSSTRVLLAFLSVMTLKDGLANLNSSRQPGINNLSYSEALRLLDSLKELASIEDAHVLSQSLGALQNSISRHLLQSWRGFQELNDQVRSRSVTPSSSGSEGPPDVGPEEEKVLQELMGELGVPEKVREKLAALSSTGEKSTSEQASIKGTTFVELGEDTSIRDKASQFQNVKMKFIKKTVGENNQEKIPEQKMTVQIAGESYPKKTTVTVQQSDEYFKDSYSQESAESYHKELDVEESQHEEMDESLPELTLNGFTEFHPIEDTVSNEGSGLDEDGSAQMISAMTADDPHPNVALSSSNLMPNVSSGEQNSSLDEKAQPDSKCQFSYMDSPAETKAQSKADIPPGEKLSDEDKSDQEELLVEEAIDIDTQSKGVEITYTGKEEENVVPSEEETVEPQISVEEEKPSSSEGLEEEEDEDDICEELMGLSEEQVDEKDKLSDFQTQQGPLVEEYISNVEQTIIAQGHPEPINEKGEQGLLSQPREPPTFQIHQDLEEKHTTLDSEGKVCPSYTEGQSSPVEQHIILDNPECYSIYHESYLAELQWATGEVVSHRTTSFLYPEERTNSVGRLISNLEEQPRDTEQKEKTSTRSRKEFSKSHIEVPEVSENDEFTSVSHLSDEQAKIEEFMMGTPEAQRSPSVKDIRQTIMNNTSSQLINTSKSSPASRVTSPLAFSYDSRSRDSEGSPQASRVKSIREMFLAKSSSENQFVQRRQPSPFRSDRSDSRPGTTDSGATGSQNSSAEDTGRVSIAKGYVRKTIERLYGRGGTGPAKTPEPHRPSSASKGRRKEAMLQNTVRSLAAFHEARSRVISDLSYFNATSSFDITEPTQCIAMNAQVANQNAVLIDEGRWLMRENHPLQTATTEVTGTQSNTKLLSSDHEPGITKGDRKEDVPYSFFSSAKSPSAEAEEPVVPHCTYLTLPHGGDSEPEEDAPSVKADPYKKKREQKVSPITEAPKPRSEKNGSLPGFIPELKRSDNKVHPLMDFLPLSPPVMAQPSKKQASVTEAKQTGVAQRNTGEPDFLEMLYLMCGEHCPFL